MVIESLYVPENCLQLEKFPAHILWDKSKEVSITLTVPDKLILENIYNVSSSERNIIKGNMVTLSDFNVNGYVGFVFKSEKYDSARYTERLHFTIISDGISQEYDKDILLFRQNIDVEKIPNVITINYNEELNVYYPDTKIHLRNVGEGTAIIGVHVSDKSDKNVQLHPPDQYQEFIAKFRKSLDKHLGELQVEYPSHQEETEFFRKLVAFTGKINSKLRGDIKELNEKLEKIFEVDEKYLASFGQSISRAYWENFDILTDIEQFSNYLNSVNTGKTLIENALDHLTLKNEQQSVILILNITDVAHNDYPAITLSPIHFISSGNVHIPIYSLFELESDLRISETMQNMGD
ncbi:MAG: hypothetical protein PHE01_08350 [Methanosarcina sp.]|nr:hypothetical protein [Methanosarcina sp.]